MSHSEAVVRELLDQYLHKGHVIFLDNFYTSVPLAENLIKDKTVIVGTLRENRIGNPKDLFKKK